MRRQKEAYLIAGMPWRNYTRGRTDNDFSCLYIGHKSILHSDGVETPSSRTSSCKGLVYYTTSCRKLTPDNVIYYRIEIVLARASQCAVLLTSLISLLQDHLDMNGYLPQFPFIGKLFYSVLDQRLVLPVAIDFSGACFLAAL
jgi:hypothetical protein